MGKFYNKNLRKLAVLLLSGTFVLSFSGCSGKTVTFDTNNNNYSSYAEASNIDESSVNRDVVETTQIEETSKVIESSIEKKVESRIQSSIEYFEESILESVSTIEESSKKYDIDDVYEVLDNIDNKIENNLYKAGNEILDDYDILYDFIFEDGTIKGYTFDEVKDDIQASAMSIYLKLDQTIDEKFPNTKKKITEVYGNTKDKVTNKLNEYKGKLEDKIIEEIGEEEYQNYIDLKDDVVSAFKEQTESDIDELLDLGHELLKSIRER